MATGLLRSSRLFRRLFGAQTVSRWGDTFNQVALIVLVYQLTGSGLRVAATVAFEVVPVLVLAPLAGSIADRMPKRAVMVTADLIRAGLLLVLVFGPHGLPMVYAVAAGLAIGSVFFNPAASALLPTLLKADQLVSANSTLWSVAVASQIVLAPLAGLLVGGAGPRVAFAINAGSYLVSAAFLTGLPRGTATHLSGRWSTSVAEGFGLLRSDPVVRVLAVVQCLAALSAGATSALLVVLAERRFGLGASGFGLLLSAIGIGAALGPLLLRVRRTTEVSLVWLFGPYGLRGLVDLVLGFARSPFLAGPVLGVYGIGTSTGMVTFQTTVQTKVHASMRGRAFSILDVIWQSSRLVSILVGGVIADAVGVQSVYIFSGCLMLLACGVGLTAGRRDSAFKATGRSG